MAVPSQPLAAAHPRRVSYVLPPPSSAHPLPILGLPPWDIQRRGISAPIYSQRPPNSSLSNQSHYSRPDGDHPTHRLAVQALAIDLSTSLSSNTGNGQEQPAGILYAGGRDGLVSSWELGLETRRRRKRYGDKSDQSVGRHTERHANSDTEGDDTDSSISDDDSDTHERNSLDLQGLGSRTISIGSRKRLRREANAAAPGRDSSTDTATKLNAVNEMMAVEDRWEVDPDKIHSKGAPPARFRQCIQSHTDWVNDVVLCNYNRTRVPISLSRVSLQAHAADLSPTTVVSASSDSLIVAWNPHSSNHDEQVTPIQIGRHGDYVRCLASARDAGWVASGGFDRKIKLWDLTEGRSSPALELPSPPGSIYSLSATPSGSLLAVGTPERVVRVYDPNSRRQVSRLGGHTDNVRAVLLSEDGKWVLSASSDSTVKLWSLTAQRCLHTFSHHSSPVWSLFSQHPNLERFYSGDRNGNICKIDFEGAGDPGDGECILLARDSPDETGEVRTGYEGITQIVAQDDSWVWSAGGSSSVKRWRDVPPRKARAGVVPLLPIRRDSLMSTSESHEHFLGGQPLTPPRQESPVEKGDRATMPSVTFLQDLTSTLSRTTSSPTQATFNPTTASQFTSAGRPSSLRNRPASTTAPSRLANRRSFSDGQRPPPFNSGESSPALAPPILSTLNDIPYETLIPLTSSSDTYFSPGFASRNRDPESASVLSIPAGFRPQSLADTPNDPESQAAQVARREYFERESALEATPLRSSPDDVIEGSVGLTRCELLNDRRHALTVDTEGGVALWDIVECCCLGVFSPEEISSAFKRPSDSRSSGSGGSSGQDSPQDVLDFVRERIEGEGATASWCKVDTRVGALTVHLEEQRVFDAEVYVDEAHLGEVGGEFPQDHRLHLGKWVLRQLFDGFIRAEMQSRTPATPTSRPTSLRSTSTHPKFISLSDLDAPVSPPRALKTPGMTIALATPALRRAVLPTLTPLDTTASPRSNLFNFEAPLSSPGLGGQTPRWSDTTAPPTPTAGNGTKTPTGARGGGMDYFSIPTVTSDNSGASGASTAPLPSAGGTLMGRLRGLGKSSKRPATGEVFEQKSEQETMAIVDESGGNKITHFCRPSQIRTVEEEQQHQILEMVFSLPLTPCPSVDAPYLRYPRDMAVLISEETPDASAWGVTYRGIIGTSSEDVHVLEQKAPFWLLDFLLGNRVPAKDPVKISFVIQPWMDVERAGLPELPNANARLTANRTLRMRKVMGYIADKLDLREMGASRAPSISGAAHLDAAPEVSSSASSIHRRQGFIPEDELEILCGDVLMTGKMTLATARAFYWKQGGDLILSYRLKQQ
ncbi:WD repeat-containing protein 48, partial [Phenoliferia sp. Uapishka_3]